MKLHILELNEGEILLQILLEKETFLSYQQYRICISK